MRNTKMIMVLNQHRNILNALISNKIFALCIKKYFRLKHRTKKYFAKLVLIIVNIGKKFRNKNS